MESFAVSMDRYERDLKRRLRSDLVTADLDRKHEKMREGDAFVFLRATYWRWAETILDLCPDFADAPPVLAIGDTHVENFGTWRDAEGRLVWGANDFDEAAEMPWTLDILRLAASAILVGGLGPKAICDAIATGYARGLADPHPVILERDHEWLRNAVLVSEKRRAKFWAENDQPSQTVKRRFAAALKAAMPGLVDDLRLFPRFGSGTGSLGRPRFVATGLWQGGPVVREVKLLLPSVWAFAHGVTNPPIRAAEIAGGRYRAPDPHYRMIGDLAVRRLSPNNRKVEIQDRKQKASFLSPRLLRAMGREIANCHAGDTARLPAIRKDMESRTGDWLTKAAKIAAQAVEQDRETYLA